MPLEQERARCYLSVTVSGVGACVVYLFLWPPLVPIRGGLTPYNLMVSRHEKWQSFVPQATAEGEKEERCEIEQDPQSQVPRNQQREDVR